jgi:hypothetical protein
MQKVAGKMSTQISKGFEQTEVHSKKMAEKC